MTRLTFLAEDLILHPANHSLAGKDKRFVGAERKIEILWLGQSATRITTISGKVIFIDP
jgi:hypothetical protein